MNTLLAGELAERHVLREKHARKSPTETVTDLLEQVTLYHDRWQDALSALARSEEALAALGLDVKHGSRACHMCGLPTQALLCPDCRAWDVERIKDGDWGGPE